jgi:hypothetical protein
MDDLISQYKLMAATGVHFPGTAIVTHKDEIKKLIKQYDARKLLDYGCGRGDAYRAPHRLHAEWGLKWWDVTLYDPAFPAVSEVPHGKFDGVLCSDVLEHIPEEDVDEFVKRLFGYARKFVWASVCCRPAKKTFPDGGPNLHVTLYPLNWWVKRFTDVSIAMGDDNAPFHLTETP